MIESRLLLLVLFGVILFVIGGFLIQADYGSCPAQTTNQGCYHIIFGFLPMAPIGWVLLLLGIWFLIMVAIIKKEESRKKRSRMKSLPLSPQAKASGIRGENL